ncbi:MAG: ComEC/Rec2 family competence protein [Paracoccaceae bacterium]|nr:ComEC/Rec2 family competence protein [Paracoccaceae bacterium]MDG1368680.1 ComEC/Rec2 family competence protein [Paracoccaceae bacterium]
MWTPVLLGLGVQIYFWMPVEPDYWMYTISLATPLLIFAALWRRIAQYWLIGFLLMLVALGFSLAGLRAYIVAAPVVEASMDATVEGLIAALTSSQSGRPRLLLEDVVVFGLTDAQTPSRTQITLLGRDDLTAFTPGVWVSVFAQIGPPGSPVEPGGFDCRRTAWFDGLGAVGFARGSAVVIKAPGRPGIFSRISLQIAMWRAALSNGIRSQLEGEEGAFAAAVIVGDRVGVSRDSTQALRDSNLAHLLAISGLHMGLATALLFGASRLILALLPIPARRWRIKAIAAGIALAGAFAYLVLSGMSIATQRAFIMVAVALIAIMLNRPPITLRALTVAALLILTLRPESLTHVGFQMSFAATAAIIAGFEWARQRGWSAWAQDGGIGKRIFAYVIALAATSLLAGLATAPFAAFHFNRAANYGLIANLAAVPIMGFWVAPSALIAGALAPIGLEGWALAVMGKGIATIMSVARFVAGLDGAIRPIAATAPLVLTLITFGGLGVCLGRTWMRWIGVGLVSAGLATWMIVDIRPALLVAPDGRLMGVRTDKGRVVDHPRAESYVASQWLIKDGDLANQEQAAERIGLDRGYSGGKAQLENGWLVMNVIKRNPDIARLSDLCKEKTVLIVPHIRNEIDGPCIFLFGDGLKAAGALAFMPEGEGVKITTAAQMAGRRFWTGYQPGGAGSRP